jgi:hypothetical protein
MGAFTDVTAVWTILMTSAAISGVGVDGGSAEFEDEGLFPLPQDKHSNTTAQSSKERTQRSLLLIPAFLIRGLFI